MFWSGCNGDLVVGGFAAGVNFAGLCNIDSDCFGSGVGLRL